VALTKLGHELPARAAGAAVADEVLCVVCCVLCVVCCVLCVVCCVLCVVCEVLCVVREVQPAVLVYEIRADSQSFELVTTFT
jgi:hypothetical protein